MFYYCQLRCDMISELSNAWWEALDKIKEMWDSETKVCDYLRTTSPWYHCPLIVDLHETHKAKSDDVAAVLDAVTKLKSFMSDCSGISPQCDISLTAAAGKMMPKYNKFVSCESLLSHLSEVCHMAEKSKELHYCYFMSLVIPVPRLPHTSHAPSQAPFCRTGSATNSDSKSQLGAKTSMKIFPKQASWPR
jgi:hypothetical protein